MLSSIIIQDFAVIKQLELELKPGLNIITGETGAGKSVIIEAISMALGSRADTAYVRKGCEKAVITLLVDTDDCKLSDVLEEIGAPDDNPLVIRREISNQSKSVCRVNGTVVPLNSLSLLCKRIADIHGQYDQQILLDPNNHLSILDAYAGDNLLYLKEQVSDAYREFAEYSTQLYKLKKELQENQKNKDFLEFECKEIENAKLVIGEDDALADEIKIMQNSEKLYDALSTCYATVYASDNSSLDNLSQSMRSLESVQGYTKDIDALIERFQNAFYELEDMEHDLRNIKDRISYSQDELDSKIERFELIKSLKKKYNNDISGILDHLENAKLSLSALENADYETSSLENAILQAKQKYDQAANRLSEKRKEYALELELAISKELKDLNFNESIFKVRFNHCNSSDNGIDTVEFMISTNKGIDPAPLAKIVSGGELSRIMLALKRIIGDIDGVPSMIFDEIDTGISGATASVVGEKLEAISNNHQVICITHLPQIASKGNNHYLITKTVDSESTSTDVIPLNTGSRIEEIARMLSGSIVNDSARLAAKELLGLNG